jgi:hypothetical protein
MPRIKRLFWFYREKIKEEKMQIQTIPKNLKKEIGMLQNLGLEDYEISYLINMKMKSRIAQRWA